MSVEIKYNGSTIANLESGQTATLPCSGKKMVSDLEVIASQAADSPLPIEVATEDTMTALLETAEIGSVYKYTGTTGTYENGALYVVEEEEVKTYTLRVDMSGVDPGFDAYFTPDKTPTDYSDYRTNVITPGSVPYTIEGIKSFVYVGYPFDFNASKSSFVNCTYENDSSLGALKITVTGANASCNIWADD